MRGQVLDPRRGQRPENRVDSFAPPRLRSVGTPRPSPRRGSGGGGSADGPATASSSGRVPSGLIASTTRRRRAGPAPSGRSDQPGPSAAPPRGRLCRPGRTRAGQPGPTPAGSAASAPGHLTRPLRCRQHRPARLQRLAEHADPVPDRSSAARTRRAASPGDSRNSAGQHSGSSWIG